MSDPLRFFVTPESLLGEPIIIEGESYHHLRNVLRVKTGARVLLLDGRGGCCDVKIEQLEPKQATASVIRRWQQPREGLSITLMQALPKGDKFDLVLQKGTELGVNGFQPLATEHAVPNLSQDRLVKREQRWQRIVSEAARQSRRFVLPVLQPLQKLSDALNEESSALKLVLWEAGAVPLAEALPSEAPEEVKILIGPEGGFSQTEIAEITAKGFQPVHLGPRILRTETAGLAATPILQYLYGDWQRSPVENHSYQPEEKL